MAAIDAREKSPRYAPSPIAWVIESRTFVPAIRRWIARNTAAAAINIVIFTCLQRRLYECLHDVAAAPQFETIAPPLEVKGIELFGIKVADLRISERCKIARELCRLERAAEWFASGRHARCHSVESVIGSGRIAGCRVIEHDLTSRGHPCDEGQHRHHGVARQIGNNAQPGKKCGQ